MSLIVRPKPARLQKYNCFVHTWSQHVKAYFALIAGQVCNVWMSWPKPHHQKIVLPRGNFLQVCEVWIILRGAFNVAERWTSCTRLRICWYPIWCRCCEENVPCIFARASIGRRMCGGHGGSMFDQFLLGGIAEHEFLVYCIILYPKVFWHVLTVFDMPYHVF